MTNRRNRRARHKRHKLRTRLRRYWLWPYFDLGFVLVSSETPTASESSANCE